MSLVVTSGDFFCCHNFALRAETSGNVFRGGLCKARPSRLQMQKAGYSNMSAFSYLHPCAKFFPTITSSQETCVLRRERKQSYSVCPRTRPKPTLSLPSFRSYLSPASCFIFQLFASLSLACLYMSPHSHNPVAPLSNILLWLGSRGRQKEEALFALSLWTLLDVCATLKSDR